MNTTASMTPAASVDAGAHTPGPWQFLPHYLSADDAATATRLGMEIPQALTNEGQRIVMSGPGDDRCRIALVDPQTPFKRGKGHEVSCAERDANAHLIAAAPELLEALTRLLSNHCPLTGNPSPQTLKAHWQGEKSQGNGEADDMLLALAAIAKATGVTP